MTLPASGYLSDSGRTHGEMAQALEDQRDAVAQTPNAQGTETVTIASGVISPVSALVRVDTEGGASTDDLTNISTAPFENGSLMFIWPNNNNHDVTLKDSANSLDGYLSLGGDRAFYTASQFMILRCRKLGGGTAYWEFMFVAPGLGSEAQEVFRSTYHLAKDGARFQAFEAGGTFTVPEGVESLEVIVVAGGGGGGGGASNTVPVTDGDAGDAGEASSAVHDNWTVTTGTPAGGAGGLASAGPPGSNWLTPAEKTPHDPFGRGGAGGSGLSGGGDGCHGEAQWVYSVESVDPGDEIAVTVGTGGPGGHADDAGNDGEDGGDGIVVFRW